MLVAMAKIGAACLHSPEVEDIVRTDKIESGATAWLVRKPIVKWWYEFSHSLRKD